MKSLLLCLSLLSACLIARADSPPAPQAANPPSVVHAYNFYNLAAAAQPASANPPYSTVRAGDGVIEFRCPDMPQPVWLKNGKVVQQSQRIQMVNNVLRIQNPHTQDSGLYTLQGTSAFSALDLRVTPAFPSNAFSNISTLLKLSQPGEQAIQGFVVEGSGPQTVLIRAVGPSLVDFGIYHTLAEPRLYISGYDDKVHAQVQLPLDKISKAVGAFPLRPNSKDVARAVILEPGTYTLLVRGANNSTGHVLVETYGVPDTWKAETP